ncbi:tyrosine-sulfated glycopeptide receptor 1-like isoform X2 [Pyrus x bretschneideri]|uniref:tyrosine-sulfated glycopeptide receptor 1-like isoform X2 n=1 Tax=Pyrus x bretschneideri TaxID=225117 RepID=UPI00202FC2CD|nr:tyrosine-sulfated glycopeptide receptor 1-like isoform X2 [Pyrus x bretschneideri]
MSMAIPTRTMLVKPNRLTNSYVLLFLLFIASIISTTHAACSKIDQHSLLSSFDIASSSLNWSSKDCCRWEGIICNMAGRVTHLLLPSKRLKGIISPSLGNLTHLSHLNLSHNILSGHLEAGFFLSLSRLHILDLSYNFISGEVPLSLPSSHIRLVDLSSNQFNGTIPSSFLQRAWNLSNLNVSNNFLTGQIPSSICFYSSSVRLLDFSHNEFSGIIPLGIGNCSKLELFRAGFNNLLGTLPTDIHNPQALEEISLPSNKLSGPIGAMKILKDSKSLRVLLFTSNFLGEEMPDGDLMVDSFGFQNLSVLSLSRCQLTGKVPIWLSKLEKMEVLDLSSNRLVGSIPVWLVTLQSLSFLNLNNNFISGEFPKELCELPAFVTKWEENQTGHGDFELPVYYQSINGSATLLQYKYISNLPKRISFRNNSLISKIPLEIGKLQLLQELDIGFNNFFGNIPNQISNLPNLERLDLSRNHFSGELPASLSSLHFLSSFSVAYNNLQGKIPLGTQLQGFNDTAFEGNPGLCGFPLPNECQKKRPGDTTKNREDVHDTANGIPWLHISVSLGFILGFWGVCGPLALSRSWRFAYFQFLSNIVDRFVC